MSKNQEIQNALYQLSTSENFDIENNDIKQQFLNIYNQIFDNKENNSINKNSSNIRILSLNEWNKYIANDTLNGSISAKNINVWHYIQTTDYYKELITDYKQVRETYDKVSYFELFSDNTSNIIKTNMSYKINLKCNWTNRKYPESNQYYWGVESYQSPASFSKSLSLNSFNFECIAPSNKGYTYDTPSNDYSFVALRIRTKEYMCFRPVLQYVDNKKSNNIYK